MSSSRITIPEGFRFHPSEEELLRDYLEKQIQGMDSQIKDIIPVIDVCKHEPRDLPALVFTMAEFLGNECYYSYMQWHFFSPLHYKYSNSTRSNRTTEQGFWKITGKDRAIKARGSKAEIGRKRTLTFYQRRGEMKPKKTDWVIHEYYCTAKGKQIGGFVLCCLKNKSDKFDHDKDAPFFDGGEPGSGSSSMASNVENQITEAAEENLASKELGNVSNGNDDEAEPCSGSYHIIPNGNDDAFNGWQTGSCLIDKNELSNCVEGQPDSCNPSDSDMIDESPISTKLGNVSHGANVHDDECRKTNYPTNDDDDELVSNTASNSDNQAAYGIPEGNSQPGANLGLGFDPFQQQDYDSRLPSIDGGPRYFSHINNFIGWDDVIFSPEDINSSLAYFSTIIDGGSGVGSDRNTEVVHESVKDYSALAGSNSVIFSYKLFKDLQVI